MNSRHGISGIDGLSELVQEEFHLNPLEKGSLFLFCGRRSDRIKGLLFEGDGFLLLYKRLVPGFRFQWPRNEKELKLLTQQQFRWLMEGLSISQKNAFKPGKPGTVF